MARRSKRGRAGDKESRDLARDRFNATRITSDADNLFLDPSPRFAPSFFIEQVSQGRRRREIGLAVSLPPPSAPLKLIVTPVEVHCSPYCLAIKRNNAG